MKKIISSFLAAVMAMSMLTACGGEEKQPEVTPTAEFKMATLKGPTGVGMVKLIEDAEKNNADESYEGNKYDVTIYGTPSEITPLLVQGEIDVATIPANLAATLYKKTEGKIQVAAINTLGVLYMMQTGDQIKSIEDVKGKTIYSPGRGSTPEYIIRHVLIENGIDPDKDVTIEFKSEPTEIGALLATAKEDTIALLPQPYATAVMAKNENVKVALNMTEEWDKVSEHPLVTGVMVARKDFIDENKEAFDVMLDDYENSLKYTNENVDEAAKLVVKNEIVPKEPIAKKAIPLCNVTYIDGADMEAALVNYYQVLFDMNPAAIGGGMPDEGFYYIPENSAK